MKNVKKQTTLKKIYFRSFLLLVIVPLLLVFTVAIFIVGYIVRNSAVNTIDAFQNNIATVLKNDIKTASLQLSHFAFVNDNEFTSLAAQLYTANLSEKHEISRQLDRAFRSAMVPSQAIVSGMFYMRDGGSIYMKDNIMLSYDDVSKESWYKKAVESQSKVVVAGYDTSKINLTANTQKGNQLIVVTAMAPDSFTDKSESIELLSFFMVSSASETIRAGNQNPNLGVSVLLDDENRLIYGDMGNEYINKYFTDSFKNPQPSAFTQKARLSADGKDQSYYFKTCNVPMSNWKIVTFIETSRLTQGFNRIGLIMVGVIAFLLLLFYVFSRYFLNAIITPVHTVADGMKQLVNNNLDVQVVPEGQIEIRTLMESFNQMVLSLKHMLTVNEEAQKRKHLAEMQSLQSQINPHFIVNALNSIRFMAQVAKFDGMQKMAEALINIVSCSFRKNVSFYSLKEELDVLDSYIYIMRIRYSDGFEVEYEIDEECLDLQLPRLTLQPIVENAITHGFIDISDEMGHIKISASKNEKYLRLCVHDNGCGMSQEQIFEVMNRKRAENDNMSIGLENVLTRLNLKFGSNAQLNINSVVGKYTQVEINLPLTALSSPPFIAKG